MNTNNESIWSEQIAYQKTKRYITYGLTIPYIIGSYKVLGQPLNPTEKSISILFEDILSSESNMCAVIQKCPDIGHYVIGLEDKAFCEYVFNKNISLKNSKGDNVIYITLNANDLGNTFENIIGRFKQLYDPQLLEENYSWDKSKDIWRSFSETEKEIIMRYKI